jgi:uncharacterized protein YkwD
MRRIAARFAISSLLAVTAVSAAPALAGAAACSGAGSSPAKLGRAAVTRTTLCLLNQQRAAHHLRALRLDGKLGKAARGHAGAMVRQHFFAHNSRNGTPFDARIKRTGWMKSRRAYTVGENIGYGSGSLASPRAMVAAWMRSAPHRANILSGRFRLIGIGVANGSPTGGGGATYATDFGG